MSPSQTNKQNKDSQLPLGLHFSGIRILQNFGYKIKKSIIILDQFTYWRSSLLWLVITLVLFLGGLTLYWLSDVMPDIPTQAPLLYYLFEKESILIDVSSIPYLVIVYTVLAFFAIWVGSKLFYKLRSLCYLILLSTFLSTVLFYIALYKSISLLIA